MGIFERVSELCDDRKISIRKLERDNELSNGTVAKWKDGTVPNGKVLLKLSEYFGVSADYILTGEQDELSKDKLHSDPEIAEMVNTVARIPEAKIFLSAIKDMPKEDLETITALVKKMVR